MKRLLLSLAVLALLISVPGALAAEDGDKCNIEGTWYGYNGLGESFVMTATRTGSNRYSVVGQAPAVAPAYPGVEGAFPGVQGDLVRTGPGTYDSSWMLIWKVNPSDWFGFELLAIVPYGEIWMTDCNNFEALFNTDLFLYNFGDDPFEDGFQLDPVGPYPAFYKRLPQYQP